MKNQDYNEYILEKKEMIVLSFVLIVFLLLIGNLFFRTGLFLLFFPVLIGKSKNLYMHYVIEKRKKNLLIQYRDLLYELASSFSAGRHMEESLKESFDKLKMIYEEDTDILREVRLMLDCINSGETELNVWENFAERSHLPDIEDFVIVFRVCRETGGDFIQVLNYAAKLIGEKILIENDIRAMIIQKRIEGNIIAVMPFIIILFLRISSPDYMTPMYETIIGRGVMLIALILIIFAYRIIERIVKIEI